MPRPSRFTAFTLYLALTGAGSADVDPGDYAVFTRSGTVILNARLIEETEDTIRIATPGAEKGILIHKSNLLLERMNEQNSKSAVLSRNSTNAMNRMPDVLSHNSGRVSFFGFFGATLGQLKNLIPSGSSGYLSYDHRFGSSATGSVWVPGLSVELGFFALKNLPIEVSGFTARAGFIWFVPVRFLRSQIFATAIAGRALLHVRDATFSADHEAFTAAAVLGYERQFGRLGVFLQSRLEYFFDPEKPLYALGGAFGISVKFGETP